MRMIKTFLVFVGLALATMVAPAVANAQDWIAVAVNDYGYGAASGYDEYDAKDNARRACEQNTGSTCRRAVSVPSSWHLVAIRCHEGYGSTYSVAGSQRGWDAAAERAANRINCWRYRTLAQY